MTQDETDRGYTVLEYATEGGGQVGSLSEEELEEILNGIQSETVREEIRRCYHESSSDYSEIRSRP